MNRSDMTRFIRNIKETQDDEISCSECFEQVSDYVDLEIAGEDAAKKMALAKQHFVQCRVCREEYETLLELARQEAANDKSS